MSDVVLIRLRSGTRTCNPPIDFACLLKWLSGIEGVRPVFIDAHRDALSEEGLLSRIGQTESLLIVFRVLPHEYPVFRAILPRVRATFPDAKTVACGPQVSALPEYILKENPGLDYVLHGEAEIALSRLVVAQMGGAVQSGVPSIPNLGYRVRDEIRINPVEFLDVDELGAPDWGLVEPLSYPANWRGLFRHRVHAIPILTSRGCPCCAAHCAAHVTGGRSIRLRRIGGVVDEIQDLQSIYDCEEFAIQDDAFTHHKDHVIAFADELERRNLRCRFSIPRGVRIDRVDDEIARRLKWMGTHTVGLDIGSASKAAMASMKRDWDVEQLTEAIRLLKRKRISVFGHFSLGFPGETMDDIKATIDFAVNSRLDGARFGPFAPLPGSEVFDRLIESGEIQLDEIDWTAYASDSGRVAYHPKDVPKDELLEAVHRATRRFYRRPRRMFGLTPRIPMDF